MTAADAENSPLDEAAARLRAWEPETDDPETAGFAQFLAGRFEGLSGRLRPQDFLLLAELAITDLRRGVDGGNREAIDHPLARQDSKTYDRLYRQLPRLGDISVSAAFGQNVQNLMVEIGLIPAPEASEAPTLSGGEIITEPIRDIQTAHRLVVEDARDRILELDWQRRGVTPEQARMTFDGWFGMVLRNSPFEAAVSVMSEQHGQDRELIGEFLTEQRMALTDQVWLVLLMDEVPAEYATATRDMLYLKMVEVVATAAGLDREQILYSFVRDVDGPLIRAAARLEAFIHDHPELIRSPEAEL